MYWSGPARRGEAKGHHAGNHLGRHTLLQATGAIEGAIQPDCRHIGRLAMSANEIRQ
jgi:hypothetical protein